MVLTSRGVQDNIYSSLKIGLAVEDSSSQMTELVIVIVTDLNHNFQVRKEPEGADAKKKGPQSENCWLINYL